MNKINYLIISFFLINNCSFDNKTGIWTGSDQIAKKENNSKQNTEFIFKKQNNTIEEIDLLLSKQLK